MEFLQIFKHNSIKLNSIYYITQRTMTAIAQKSSGNLLVNTIPLPKITALINDFITKNITHLNKLSSYVEEKLMQFDNKLQNIEAMVTLLEAKLNSLPPEITSSYPPLAYCSLDDINPVIVPAVATVATTTTSQNVNQNVAANEVVKKETSEVVVDTAAGAQQTTAQPETSTTPQVVEETPENMLKNFLEKNSSEQFENLYKMLKFGIPEQAIMQKAMFAGINMTLVETLVKLFKNANPTLN